MTLCWIMFHDNLFMLTILLVETIIGSSYSFYNF